MKPKYKQAIMDMAERFGQTSEATRLKVGALLYKNNTIIAMGTNGTPAGWHTNQCEDANGDTTPIVIHAEDNMLRKLYRSSETSDGAWLFCTHMPCLSCAVKLVEARIEKVFYRHSYKSTDGLQYLQDHGVLVAHLG
jgi:dCMP deaminase